MKPAKILKYAKSMMMRSDVLVAIRDKIELTTGFTTVEADNWLVKHIRGDIEQEQIVSSSDGPVKMRVKAPPSLRALEIYKRSTEPQPAKNVTVRSQSVVARINIGDDPPPMRARSIEGWPSDEH